MLIMVMVTVADIYIYWVGIKKNKISLTYISMVSIAKTTNRGYSTSAVETCWRYLICDVQTVNLIISSGFRII